MNSQFCTTWWLPSHRPAPHHHHSIQPSTPTAITHPPTPASTHLPTHHRIAQCKLQCPMQEQQCSSMTLHPMPSARATMQLNDIASNAQCQSHNAHHCHCTQCPMPEPRCTSGPLHPMPNARATRHINAIAPNAQCPMSNAQCTKSNAPMHNVTTAHCPMH